jgi:hypothetical protein
MALSWLATVKALLALDFSTASAVFVPVLTTAITPVAGSSLRFLATANFVVDGITAPATAKFRLVDDQQGTLIGAEQTVLTKGENGCSISLLWELDGIADDLNTVTLECQVSSGTLRIRPVTKPDSEGAVLIVDNFS